MSKNTDFPRLGPYSHKNIVRLGIEMKIRQIEVKRMKTGLTRAKKKASRRRHAWVASVQSQVSSPVWVDSSIQSGGSQVRLGLRVAGRVGWSTGLDGSQETHVVVSLKLRWSSQCLTHGSG